MRVMSSSVKWETFSAGCTAGDCTGTVCTGATPGGGRLTPLLLLDGGATAVVIPACALACAASTACRDAAEPMFKGALANKDTVGAAAVTMGDKKTRTSSVPPPFPPLPPFSLAIHRQKVPAAATRLRAHIPYRQVEPPDRTPCVPFSILLLLLLSLSFYMTGRYTHTQVGTTGPTLYRDVVAARTVSSGRLVVYEYPRCAPGWSAAHTSKSRSSMCAMTRGRW